MCRGLHLLLAFVFTCLVISERADRMVRCILRLLGRLRRSFVFFCRCPRGYARIYAGGQKMTFNRGKEQGIAHWWRFQDTDYWTFIE